MARLLWISKETPDRFGQGGQRRQYFQMCELLDAGHQITAVVARGEQDPTSVSALAEVRWFGSGRFGREGRSLPSRLALQGSHDGVVVAHSESYELLRGRAPRIRPPVLLDFHNVNSRWYRKLGDADKAQFWDEEEGRIVKEVDVVLSCSRAESAALPSGVARSMVAPHGVDLVEWPALEGTRRRARSLVAFGSWWYPSNQKGLRWFLEQVWPVVLSRVPDARFVVAGSGDPPGVAGAPNTEHLGRVADIAGLLRSASAVVVPVLQSAGTPVKFAEALASGSPVVATPEAGEGFPAAPAVVTADAHRFADSCVAFLQDPALSDRTASVARDFVETHCTWTESQRPLLDWAASLS